MMCTLRRVRSCKPWSRSIARFLPRIGSSHPRMIRTPQAKALTREEKTDLRKMAATALAAAAVHRRHHLRPPVMAAAVAAARPDPARDQGAAAARAAMAPAIMAEAVHHEITWFPKLWLPSPRLGRGDRALGHRHC